MNDLQRQILFLASKPITGYDLTKQIAGTVKNSHQQVYRDAGRLEKNGLLSSKKVPQDGKPDRKEYTVTQAGLDALKVINKEPIDIDNFNRGNLMTAIMTSTDDSALLENLEQYKAKQLKNSKFLAIKKEPFFVYRKLMIDAQLQFVDTLITSLVKQGK